MIDSCCFTCETQLSFFKVSYNDMKARTVRTDEWEQENWNSVNEISAVLIQDSQCWLQSPSGTHHLFWERLNWQVSIPAEMPTSFHEYKRYQHRSAVCAEAKILMLDQPKVITTENDYMLKSQVRTWKLPIKVCKDQEKMWKISDLNLWGIEPGALPVLRDKRTP